MADLPEELLPGRPSQARTAPEAPTTPPPSGARFKRNLFLNEWGTGEQQFNRGEWPKGGELRSEYVRFDERLHKKFTNFLDNYAQALLRAENENPGILNNPRHRHDAELLLRLTTEQKTAGGELMLDTRENPIRAVLMEKVSTFLDTPEGWIIAKQLLEHQTALQLYALAGTVASMRPPAERQPMPDLRHGIPIEIDRGVLNSFLEEVVGPVVDSRITAVGGRANVNLPPWLRNLRFWQVAVPTVGVAGVGAAAGGVAFGEFGALAGAAAPPAIEGLIRLLRGGVRMDFSQVASAFRLIESDPAERAYVKTVLGVDARDFRFNAATGAVELARTTTQTLDVRKIQREILDKLYTRQQYYEALGVPQNQLDTLPEQFLYTWQTAGRKEETADVVDGKIQDEFRRGGGIRDGAGLRPEQAGFNSNNLDVRGNLRRFFNARRKVVSEMVKELLHKEITKTDVRNPITTLEQKKRDRSEETGIVREARARQFTERKTLYEEYRTLTQTDKEKLDTYNQALTAIANARAEAQRNFGAADIAAIQAQIDARQNNLTNVALAGSYARRANQLENQRRATITTAEAAIPATFAGRAREDEVNRRARPINERFDRMQATLKEQVADSLTEEIKQLKALRQTIETSQAALAETQTVVTESREILNALDTDFDNVVGPVNGIVARLTAAGLVLPAGFTLTEADLRTLPIDVLIQRINQANTLGAALVPPVGWPEIQNGRAENRRRLVHAIVEARARQLNPVIGAPSPDFTAFTNPVQWNISENQLRVLTTAQLNQLLTDRVAANPALAPLLPAATAAINAVQTEARDRLQGRFNAYEQQINDFTRLMQEQDEASRNINLDQEVDQLDLTISLLRRREKVNEEAPRIISHAPDFTNTQVVAAGEVGYTPAEQNASFQKGYYELVDFLFDYRIRPDREEYFQKIVRLLPPQKLADVLYNALGYTFAMPPTPHAYLDAVFNQMRIDITANRITSPRARNALRAVGRRLTNEGLALS